MTDSPAVVRMDPAELERRKRQAAPIISAALAEAGYPTDLHRAGAALVLAHDVPLPVVWKAGMLAAEAVGLPMPCFDCYAELDGRAAGRSLTLCVERGHQETTA